MTDKLLYTFFNKNLPEIKKGRGIYLYEKSGTRLTDLTGGSTGHAILGWGNKSINNSIVKQLNNISHIDYKYWKDDNRSLLANLILSNKINKLDKVFFVGSSGAEACEAAIKLSYQVHCSNGNSKKNLIISRKQSYHGCTSQTIALGDRPNLSFYKNILNKNVIKINEHNLIRHKKKNETEEQYAERSASELEKKIIFIGADRVGSFVAETMAGGLIGDVPPAKNYWKKIRKICTKYDVHLILDEVWCGTGVSGKYFCIDYDQITPDFIFISKTLSAGYGALSAVITKKILFNNVEKHMGQIQYSNTHQGHSLSVAAALAVQKIINNDFFLEKVIKKGELLRDILNSELSNHEFFVNVRGRGLRNSFEYKCTNQNLFGNTLKNILRKEDKILIDSKWHRICFSPSLAITKKEIQENLEKIIKKFKLLSKNWTSIKTNKLTTGKYF
jgi:adenosylmethionine-8-amino-7-oxononanoate aminotransferase